LQAGVWKSAAHTVLALMGAVHWENNYLFIFSAMYLPNRTRYTEDSEKYSKQANV
jgi:hypothetical protein